MASTNDLSNVSKENSEHQKPGVIGTVVNAVTGTYQQAKDAVVGKSPEVPVEKKDQDSTNYAAEKTQQAKDYTAEKAKQAKDYTTEKASQVTDRAFEIKDATMQKANEGKDASAVKLAEMKDSATDAAKRAVEFISAKQKTNETEEATKE